MDIVAKINDQIIDYRDSLNVDRTTNNLQIEDIYSNFRIRDNVVAFFNGREWNVIALDFMLKHPIFYYKHWSDKEMVYFDNSLFVCPITLRSMIYKGKIRVSKIIDYELILINTDTKDEFSISNPYTGHADLEGKEKKIKSQVKRHEVKIFEHRDMFAFESDPIYVVVDTDADYILNKEYYSNRLDIHGKMLSNSIHPKTLVYIVQYYSKTDNRYRHLVLMGSNANQDTIVGYKYRKSKVWEHVRDNKETMITKRAFIYPMLWYTIEKIGMLNFKIEVL